MQSIGDTEKPDLGTHLLRFEEILVDAAVLSDHIWRTQYPAQVFHPLYAAFCFGGRHLSKPICVAFNT